MFAAAIRRPLEGLSMFAHLERGGPRIVQKRGLGRGTVREKLQFLHGAGKMKGCYLMEIAGEAKWTSKSRDELRCRMHFGLDTILLRHEHQDLWRKLGKVP